MTITRYLIVLLRCVFLLEVEVRKLLLLPLLLFLPSCRVADVMGPSADRALALSGPRRAAVVSGLQTVPSPSGLQACWSGEGAANDVISGNTGALIGGVSYVPGRFGQGFSFDSLGGDVQVPASASLDVGQGPGLTMAAWFYARGGSFGGAPGAGPIMEFNFGAQLWQHYQGGDDNGLFTNLAESNATWHIIQVPRVITWNTWQHGAVTYSKATGIITLYANGQPIGTLNAGNYVPNTANIFHIGARNIGSFSNVPYTFNGIIDEVQIYNRALSDTEIQQLNNAQGTMCVAPATQYAVITQPSTSGESGVPFTTQPVVEIRDASGSRVSNSIAPVTATITSGTGTLIGTTTVNAVGGLATFTDLGVAGAASNTVITFTAGTLPPSVGVPSTTAPIATVQVARKLAVTTQPSGAASISPFTVQPVIEVRDAAGIRMPVASNAVTATIGSGLGVLSGTTTVNAVNGVATFSNLKITGPGVFTLNFAAAGLTGATSASFTVAALPPTLLIVAGQPGGAESGLPFTTQPVVQLLDATNSIAIGATNAVTVAIASGTGTLSGTTTVISVNGVATFTDLKIAGTGPHTLKFTAVGGLLSATSNPFTVTQSVRQLTIASQPSALTSGRITAPFVIELRDGAGLLMNTSTSPVRANIAYGSATISGTTTVNAVNGVATFTNLALTGNGPVQVSFWLADTATYAAAFVISGQMTLTQPVPTQLGIATQPSGAVSGAPFTSQPVVEIRDVTGLAVTSATNAVTVAIASGTGTLSGTTTVNAVNGVATFTDLKIVGSGPHTLTFTTSGLSSATSGSFTVTQIPSQLAVTAQQTSATSGTALSTISVEIRDALGAKVIGATNAVKVSVTSGTATLAGTTTVNAVNGVATFPGLTLSGSGAVTLTYALVGNTPAVSVNGLPVFLTAAQQASPTQLGLTTQPVGGNSGNVLGTQPVVEIRDASGNRVASATNAVTATINSGSGTLAGTVTVNAINGVATFTNLTITGAGSFTLKFTASGLTSVTSGSFTVTALPQYDWEGFYQPIDNDRFNKVNAGQAVPVRFSLGGNPGSNVFAAGYPASQRISCTTGAAQGPVEPIDIIGNDGSSYSRRDSDHWDNNRWDNNSRGDNHWDQSWWNNDNGDDHHGNGRGNDDDNRGDQSHGRRQYYTLVWKTGRDWGNSCRVLIVKLLDGSEHRVQFSFK